MEYLFNFVYLNLFFFERFAQNVKDNRNREVLNEAKLLPVALNRK